MDTTQTTTAQTVTRSRFKNATVIILFILLTVLAGVGIIVAINLQGSQAPDDSFAGNQDPKTGMWIQSNGTCTNAENGGTLTGYYCGTGCEAAKKCWTGAELNAFGGGCNAAYDALCQQATCAGDGAAPAPGQSCCPNLNLCGHGRCGVTCNGNVGGESGVCNTGQWVLYECKGSCSLTGGCQTPYTGPGGNTINADGRNEDEIRAEQFVAGTGGYTTTTTCYVRQADCSTTSGASLVFRSSYRCSNQCTSTGGPTTGGPTTGGPTTGQTNLFCGDAICATNELCERVSPGSGTTKACRAGDIGSAPTGQTVAECYRLKDGTDQVAGTGPRCKFCGDGVFHSAEEQCDPTAPAGNGNDPTQCSTACMLRKRACIGVNRSADTLAPGVGNKAIYTLRFQDERGQEPHVPGVYMRVSSAESEATIVGRDANATSSQRVGLLPNGGTSKVQNSDGSYNYEYKFEWEAASPSGVAVPAGTYTIQFFNGNNNQLFADNSLCESTITLSVTQVENPVFSIVKTSAPVCESDNDSRIDYTVRVTNSGPVEGLIDSVVDTLDAEVIAAGITPTNIVPTYGAYASGQITWLGTVADRTYSAGQSKDFTYSLTIPAAQVASFTGTGIDNQVVVTYDTEDSDDNTDSFTLNTPVACSTPPVTVIPETGIFDDGRFLILGALFVLTGIYVYRRQFILEHSFETEIERKLSRKADGQD